MDQIDIFAMMTQNVLFSYMFESFTKLIFFMINVSFSDDKYPFKFAILVAGFKSKSAAHAVMYSNPITMPSLHVFGETDQVIAKGLSLSK